MEDLNRMSVSELATKRAELVKELLKIDTLFASLRSRSKKHTQPERQALVAKKHQIVSQIQDVKIAMQKLQKSSSSFLANIYKSNDLE